MAGVTFNVKFDENMKRILKDDEYRNLEKGMPAINFGLFINEKKKSCYRMRVVLSIYISQRLFFRLLAFSPYFMNFSIFERKTHLFERVLRNKSCSE